tara:strand:+ start:1061 stop:1192 length:132 start_codon:yes stop_codon:yes gene_type:complete
MIESSIGLLIVASAVNPTNIAIYLPLLMLLIVVMGAIHFIEAG